MDSHKATDQDGVSHIRLGGQTVGKWTGSALTYLHTDHLGTPIRGTHGLPDSDPDYDIGDEVFQEFYTPYGMQPTFGWWGKGNTANDPITGKGNNCGVTGFTDHAADCETGLVYMQARLMDPVGSRFLSIDPVDFLTDGRTGMVNWYGCTLNDSVTMVDPNGEHGEDVINDFLPSSGKKSFSPSLPFPINPLDWCVICNLLMDPQTGDPEPLPPGNKGFPGNKPPHKGEPGSTVRGGTQSTTYGDDGYPGIQRDKPHPSEGPPNSDDHVHDWGRPEKNQLGKIEARQDCHDLEILLSHEAQTFPHQSQK